MRDGRKLEEKRPMERHCGDKGKRRGEIQKGRQREREGSSNLQCTYLHTSDGILRTERG
jgi:hypothetical protein